MITSVIKILAFLIFLKLFLFWLWLWQLKNYHFGRFKAHFETNAIKKVLVSAFRLKLPKFTKKIIIIALVGVILGVLILFYYFYFAILILVVLAPLFSALLVLLLQIPVVILRNRILKKAKQKIESLNNLTVVGITGSYGKTSTKEFLAQILADKFNVLKTEKNINAEIGIAQTILNKLDNSHNVFIAEIGAYEKGKIKQVCNIIKPQIGILTGINSQHLSTFGSQDNIIKGKYELIECLPENGMAVFNGSNKYCRELYEKTNKPKKIIADKHEALQGIYSWDIENILMAVEVARHLGMGEQEINTKIKNIKSSIQSKPGINGLNIIDSSYSSNPNGIIAHLDFLYRAQPNRKKIFVMPSLIELGGASKDIHKKIGKKIAQVCDLAIITTKDRFRELKEGAVIGGMKDEDIVLIENENAILEKIKGFASSGDTVFLESRVPSELVKKLLNSSNV